ncbi:hypothetical protein LCGC14_1191800 [marine sediment metagenome]|uniref:Uncharacterized protein n=1 Tax=marine sediment metagenome TaxID=412755 RepID=A0A0F9LJ88_9ZZZZ
MNEEYPLAVDEKYDFDKPHPVQKCYGDGSIRHHCRCERHQGHEIHIPKEENNG